MRRAQARVVLLAVVLLCGVLTPVASASTLQLVVAEDKNTGYKRSLFKHWIDVDRDGCDTRAEVLIEEAVVKPKIGPKCKLTGGEWVSAYDGKKVTNASQLDVDHLVPLAEAWRSGAWQWTAAQRQAYANDLEDSRALIAVTLSSNRSKGDKDPAKWIPAKEDCNYLENWVAIKNKYALTFDEVEATKIVKLIQGCGLNATAINPLSIPDAPTPIVTYSDVMYFGEPFVLAKIEAPSVKETSYPRKYQSGISIASDSNLINPGKIIISCFTGPYEATKSLGDFKSVFGVFLPSGKNTELYLLPGPNENLVSCLLTPTLTFNISITFRSLGNINGDFLRQSQKFEIAASAPAPIPTPFPTPVPVSIVTPGAFCSPAGAIGNSTSGVTYTCKTSPTDSRNRWRQ
jgi:hypothetical protein